jgi:hypothetical protein
MAFDLRAYQDLLDMMTVERGLSSTDRDEGGFVDAKNRFSERVMVLRRQVKQVKRKKESEGGFVCIDSACTSGNHSTEGKEFNHGLVSILTAGTHASSNRSFSR